MYFKENKKVQFITFCRVLNRTNYCFELRKKKTDCKVYPNSSCKFWLSIITLELHVIRMLWCFCSAKVGNPEVEVLIFGMSF